MGCCCSCSNEEDDSLQEGEPNERTRLLQDPTSNTYQGNNSAGEYGNHYTNSLPQKSDEHSALNKVLQQTASKVIDVGALNFQALEEHEYAERARVYTQSINKINMPQNLLKRKRLCLLTDVPGAEKLLSAQPISHADLSMMNFASDRIAAAVDSIHIIHKEDLVVPFGKG